MRLEQGQKFLAANGWWAARLQPLRQDASRRAYARLIGGPRPALLMDADPDLGEDVRPFLAIAAHLHGAGLRAPQILAQDTTQGFLIIEDFGDGLIAHRAASHPDQEATFYVAAADALARLHTVALPKGLGSYDAAAMGALADLVPEWYADNTPSIAKAVEDALLPFDHDPRVLVLRDYHAENLIWTDGDTTGDRLGIIDFQDALIGHAAYDMASLLWDARRNVSKAAQTQALDHYFTQTGADPTRFSAAMAAMGAQRNLRILGVFARLCRRDGKRGYLQYLPRVWRNLQQDLSHPRLAPLRDALSHLPEPTPAFQAKLAALCPAPA